ncbi:MAG: HPr family phosphocarrier protein [Hungatella sp.]
MNRQEILLRTQNDIVNFVNKMAKYSFNADLLCGSQIVDAKSLLGVLGFGMGKTLTLQVYDAENNAWMSDISEYLVVGK